MIKLTPEKFIESGLYLLAFILPIQTRWIARAGGSGGAYSEFGTLSLYGTDILLLILLGASVFRKSREPKGSSGLKCAISGPRFFIGLLGLAAFASIFSAPDKTLAVFGYLRLLSAIGLFALLAGAAYDRAKLIIAFSAGLVLQAFLAVWQFLSQSAFASKWLGMAGHSASALEGESVIEFIGGRWLRSYGSLDHPNMLGGLLALGLMIIVSRTMARKEIYSPFEFGSKKYSSEDFAWPKIRPVVVRISLFALALVFLSAGLFFSFSRSAWLSLSAGLFVLTIQTVATRRTELFRLGKILAAVALVFIALGSIYSAPLLTRATGEGRLEEKSFAERQAYSSDYKMIIKADRWFGSGLANFTASVRNLAPGRPAYQYQPVHNVFSLVRAETGLLGLSGLVGMIFILVLQSRNKTEALPVIASLLVLMWFDHWLWSLHFGLLLCWFVFGLIRATRERALNCG